MDIPDKWLLFLIKLFLLVVLTLGLAVIAVNGLMFFITTIMPLFTPFIIALLIALIIDPLVDVLEKRLKIKRTIATFISIITFMVISGYLIVILISHAIVELIELSANLPEYYKILRLTLEDATAQAQYLQYLYFVDLPTQIQEEITNNLENLTAGLRDISVMLINYIIFLVSSLPGILTLIIIAGVATFFISRDKQSIANGLVEFLPEPWKSKVINVAADLVNALTGFLRAQLILISITGIQTIIGLYLIGVDYALSVGIIVGIVDILPILGPGIIFIPWAIALFILGQTGFALALLVLYGFVILVRTLLEPKIVADNIGLHPLTTLVAIYVGLKSIGLIGVIVGPIIVITVKAVTKKN